MGGALAIAVVERSFGNEMNNVRSWKSFSFALLPLTICTKPRLIPNFKRRQISTLLVVVRLGML